MIDSKAQKQAKPNTVLGSKNSALTLAVKSDAVPSQDIIRTRAFELYESRGCEPGQQEQDWLRAEQEILKRKR